MLSHGWSHPPLSSFQWQSSASSGWGGLALDPRRPTRGLKWLTDVVEQQSHDGA